MKIPREGEGYPLQYSGLENSMDYIVHGVAKSWTWLSDFHFTGGPVVKNPPAKQRMWVWSLVQEDPTCRGAVRACMLQRLEPVLCNQRGHCREGATAERSPHSLNLRPSEHPGSRDPVQPSTDEVVKWEREFLINVFIDIKLFRDLLWIMIWINLREQEASFPHTVCCWHLYWWWSCS